MADESHGDRLQNNNTSIDRRANIVVANNILIFDFIWTKSETSNVKILLESFVQPYYVSYLDQYTQTFSAITKSITGLTGHPRVIIVVMIYRGGFVLARMEVFG